MAKATSVVRRRRIGLALSALIAIAAAVTVFVTGDRTYEATATVLLLPPTSTVEENGNPLLQLGGLQQVVDVVAVEVSNTVNEPPFSDTNPGAEIEVAPDGRTSAPALSVIVQDDSPESALAIRDEVAAVAMSQLAEIQTAIAIEPERQITAILLTASTTAEEQLTARIRSAIVVGGGVGVALLLLAGLAESILVRRQSNGAPDPEDDTADTTTEPPPDDETDAAEVTNDLSDPTTGQRADQSSAQHDSAERSRSDLASMSTGSR